MELRLLIFRLVLWFLSGFIVGNILGELLIKGSL